MANIGTLKAWVPFEVPLSADMNANFTEIKTKFNSFAVQTDVAKTITVSHTQAADLLFSDALYDIGKSGATRPRDIFASRDLTIGGNFTPGGAVIIGASAFFQGNVAAGFRFNDAANANILVQITDAGRVLIGTSQTTNSSAGEVILANSKNLRAVTIAGNDTFALIHGDANNAVRVGAGGQTIAFGAIATLNGLGAGDLAIPNARHLRGGNAAGTNNVHLIGVNGNNDIQIGSDPSRVLVGVISTTVNSNVGDIIVANAKGLKGVNAAATSTRRLVDIDASDIVYIAGSVNIVAIGAPASLSGATAGDVVLANSRWLRGVNTAGSSAVALISLQGADQVQLAPNSVLIIGNPASQTSATAGEVVLANAKSLRATNAAATDTRALISLNGSDETVVGNSSGVTILSGTDIRWNRALVALGGGAAPTLGTIGGAGPATAAQNTWMRVLDNGGVAFWVPVWK